MVNQQKVVQQETAYSAVVVNVSPSLYRFDSKGVIETCKYDIGRDGDTGIYHPYPPSFHEMIFTLVTSVMLSERNAGIIGLHNR